MAAEPRNGARGGAAAARSRAAHLSRAQLEQKAKGQPAMLVNLRIVMSATAVTILLLLFAFAGLGLLFLARSPQEPIVTKLDLSPPLLPPAKLEPASQVKTKTIPVPAPVAETPPVKADETVSASKERGGCRGTAKSGTGSRAGNDSDHCAACRGEAGNRTGKCCEAAPRAKTSACNSPRAAEKSGTAIHEPLHAIVRWQQEISSRNKVALPVFPNPERAS
jgi:hypothetical protein